MAREKTTRTSARSTTGTQRKKIQEAPLFSAPQLAEAARVFGVLADESRLRLLQLLLSGPSKVCDLVQASGLSQANVSKHLSVLHAVSFVTRRKEGNFVIYQATDPMIKQLCGLICGRVREEALRRARQLGGE